MRDTIPMTEADLAQIMSATLDEPFRERPGSRSTLEGYVAQGDFPEMLGIPVDATQDELDVMERMDDYSEDPSRAPTILNVPGLPPSQRETQGFQAPRHILNVNIQHPLPTVEKQNGNQDERLTEMLSEQMLRIHEYDDNLSGYDNLYAAGIVATDKHIPQKLFVGIKSQFIFNLQPAKKAMCFEVGTIGGFPPGFKVLPHKAILRVAFADPVLRKAVVESYDVFKESALGRALKLHGIEGNHRATNLKVWQKFLSRDVYNAVAFALASCDYKVMPLRSFEDIRTEYA